MARNKAKYKAVIASARWRALRVRLIRERGEQCERCQKTWAPGYSHTLQLHHLTYERLGCEQDGDVQLVCGGCHERADRERAAAARDRVAAALEYARVQGWAVKKYGQQWVDDYFYGESYERVADEFYEWLDRKDDDDDSSDVDQYW